MLLNGGVEGDNYMATKLATGKADISDVDYKSAAWL
jgi:hypothetical protein